MKDAKDFDVNEFIPEDSTNGTIATGSTRQSKLSVSSEQSELTERNRIAGQTVLTSQGEHVEEIAPTPSNEQTVKPRRTVQTLANEQSVSSQRSAPAQSIEPPQLTPLPRVSTRQRRASLDEYKGTFLSIPKITDRQPVFLSHDVRDKIDGVVRRLGKRRMSVSGFLENLARHHLDLYADDLEQWKRL